MDRQASNRNHERELYQTRKLIDVFTLGRINAAFLFLVVLVLLFAVIDTYLTFMTPVDPLHPFEFSPGAWISSQPMKILQLKYLGELILILLLTGVRYLFPKKLFVYQKVFVAVLLLIFTGVIVLERFVLAAV